jgi:site-specific DNA-methyltransferase (adenine-specific)
MIHESAHGLLFHDDCRNVLSSIDDQSVDMILTDLPYQMRTACKWDVIIPFEDLWPQWERIIKPNGAIVLFSKQPFTTKVITSNQKLWRYNMIWKKTRKLGFMNANIIPLKSYEEMSVFYKKLPIYNPQGLQPCSQKVKRKKDVEGVYGNMNLKEGTYERKFKNYPTDVIEYPSDGKGKLFHPTQKPVGLFEYLIKTYTNDDAIVLDCCSGGGTTAIATINTKRRYICIEKEDKYFQISRDRIMQHIDSQFVEIASQFV